MERPSNVEELLKINQELQEGKISLQEWRRQTDVSVPPSVWIR
jgi:hypothetical protein